MLRPKRTTSSYRLQNTVEDPATAIGGKALVLLATPAHSEDDRDGGDRHQWWKLRREPTADQG